ncbi:MAG: hypothetical protein SFV32_12795 [Opitutaceae bacterium]|nr:hypothetical protein [Opitutaceae bacterium]
MSELPIYRCKWGKTRPFQIRDCRWIDGQPVTDFTGWELWLTIKYSPDDPDPGILQKKLSTGGFEIVGTTANTKITAEESRTKFAPNTIYHFDIQGRSPAGDVDTFHSGRLVFENDITKSS